MIKGKLCLQQKGVTRLQDILGDDTFRKKGGYQKGQRSYPFLQPKKKKISYDEEKFLVPQPFFVYVILDYIFIILGNK